jgi:hypothetical protein
MNGGIEMPKSKSAKRGTKSNGRSHVAAYRKVLHRVRTIKSNGDLPEAVEVAPEEVPIGEAMRRAVEELGEVVINDELAAGQLREIAEVYEDVTKAQAAFNAKNEAAKIAKKSLESVTNLLLEKVRAATHPATLPLFDQERAEDDRRDMLDAANASEGASA